MALVTIAERALESRILTNLSQAGPAWRGQTGLAAAAPERARLCKVEGPVARSHVLHNPPQPQTWSGAMGPMLLLGWGSLGEKEGECHSSSQFGSPFRSFPCNACTLAGTRE